MNDPLTMRFADDGAIPNNPRLPVLIYRRVANRSSLDLVVAIERLFANNGWLPQWRNGVYDFHHYHSTAHEALGIAAGAATVRLGGERGKTVSFQAGDVLVLPAGTGHKLLSASEDLLVVGAYPPDQSWDILRGDASERPGALDNIANVPLPKSDPVHGENGPLKALWA